MVRAKAGSKRRTLHKNTSRDDRSEKRRKVSDKDGGEDGQAAGNGHMEKEQGESNPLSEPESDAEKPEEEEREAGPHGNAVPCSDAREEETEFAPWLRAIRKSYKSGRMQIRAPAPRPTPRGDGGGIGLGRVRVEEDVRPPEEIYGRSTCTSSFPRVL
uniref:Uncharacterized protein n=1 Tax=Odontella aurita TaxID=265563 RepID=A0A7S4JAU6_9STRA|mmetsp:Transcript_42744/g.129885  ORF Transcript_42744/g.129885 Transcript_42744/m.129885 type:complete len:158 (+) Transcript_42744:1110-1583(+)